MTFPGTFPASRAARPDGRPALRWGVLGTGWIAEQFAGSAAPQHPPAGRRRRLAVGCVGEEFADRVGIGRAHGSYADLVADPEVDVVYVATPHNFHHGHALLALDAGKHVLVEKPIALNAVEAAEIAVRAAQRGVYCAEALWTFFLPSYDVIRQLLDDGVLGDVRTVLADHGEWFPDTHRILRHDLAGGALLDLGTYPLALASWVLGEPEQIVAIGEDVPGGEVHGQVSAVLRHAGRCPVGDQHDGHGGHPEPGRARRDGRHARHRRAVLLPRRPDADVGGQEVDHPLDRARDRARGLYVTAVEAARRITAGETGTPLRPLTDSVATLQVVDEIRRQIGVTFLEESAPGFPR